jgi:nitrite reductase (NADH) small subunit
MPRIRVCKAGEIADGGTRLISFDGVEIGVIFCSGAYYAYRNRCPHQGGPACEGLKMPRVVERIGDKGVHLGQDFDRSDMHIVCPWHGWEFHLADGRHCGDARIGLQKFDVIERNGDIYVAV